MKKGNILPAPTTTSEMKTAVAFLAKYPCIETINFAESIAKQTTFDVFIISDEKYNGRTRIALFPNLEIIHVPDEVCKNKKYINSNISDSATHIKKNPIAWDKLIYTFCETETQYDFVWIFEDDVFIPSVDTIVRLDKLYGEYDLVTPNHFEKKDKIKDWHWGHIFPRIPAPYYYSMVCACGIGRKLFNCIKDYVNRHRQLFYIEAMFNTLAAQKNLRVIDPLELKSIVWQGEWGLDEFLLLPDNVFHPKKFLSMHPFYRANIEKAKRDKYVPKNNLPEFINVLR